MSCSSGGYSSKNENINQVEELYKLINRTTGKVGGDADNGPIYGEINKNGLFKLYDFLIENCELNCGSKFIDIGSGIGKPNFHLSLYVNTFLSIGIEIQEIRWKLSMSNLRHLIYSTNIRFSHGVNFIHGDIESSCVKTLDPFTHVYMFDKGFNPDLLRSIASKFNRSLSCEYLISYQKQNLIVTDYSFDVEYLDQMTFNSYGCCQLHTVYIYKRKMLITTEKQLDILANKDHDSNLSNIIEVNIGDIKLKCDLFFKPCIEVASNSDRLREVVTNTYETICLADKSKRVFRGYHSGTSSNEIKVNNKISSSKRDYDYSPNKKEQLIILCLAMFQSLFDYDSCNQYNIDFGQGFRDYQKIKRLKELGYTVYSIDDKHDSIQGLHCRTNFNMYRDFYKCVREIFPFILGHVCVIVIDYFFSPVGWHRSSLNDNFFTVMLTSFADSVLMPGGKIYIPNNDHVAEMIDRYCDKILLKYTINKLSVSECDQNPLHLAAAMAKNDLFRMSVPLTNDNQVSTLNTDYPFFCLTSKFYNNLVDKEEEHSSDNSKSNVFDVLEFLSNEAETIESYDYYLNFLSKSNDKNKKSISYEIIKNIFDIKESNISFSGRFMLNYLITLLKRNLLQVRNVNDFLLSISTANYIISRLSFFDLCLYYQSLKNL